MTSSDMISILAAIISVSAALISFQSARIQLLSSFSELDRSIENAPSVLRFHGINQSDLESLELSAQEFAYMVTQFKYISYYERLHFSFNSRPYRSGSYRHSLCMSKDVRRAWPYLKRMLSNGRYTTRLEKTILMINENNPLP